MTFADAFRTLSALAESRGDEIALTVQAWSASDADGLRARIQWQCWSVKQLKHFAGETAEQCVAAYIHGVATGMADATPEALDAVGEVLL